jgi:hypothetical protein
VVEKMGQMYNGQQRNPTVIEAVIYGLSILIPEKGSGLAETLQGVLFHSRPLTQ